MIDGAASTLGSSAAADHNVFLRPHHISTMPCADQQPTARRPYPTAARYAGGVIDLVEAYRQASPFGLLPLRASSASPHRCCSDRPGRGRTITTPSSTPHGVLLGVQRFVGRPGAFLALGAAHPPGTIPAIDSVSGRADVISKPSSRSLDVPTLDHAAPRTNRDVQSSSNGRPILPGYSKTLCVAEYRTVHESTHGAQSFSTAAADPHNNSSLSQAI
jgi:hypothetical protein